MFSLTHRPFAERVWHSMLTSAPNDTAVYNYLADRRSWSLFAIRFGSKVLAADLISIILRSTTSH